MASQCSILRAGRHLVGAIGAFAAVAAVAGAQVITEFPTPTAGGPYNIALGPDGNLWFTYFNAAKIGRITPAGAITEFSTAGNPVGITAGPDGAIWFTENLSSGAGKVGRMTTAGSMAGEFTVPTAFPNLAQITTGPDGNLWFTEFSKGKIGRCTTGGGIVDFDVPAGPNSEPLGIVAGPDGALWFAEFSGAATFNVGRITTAGIVTNEYPIAHGGEEITVGSDGNLWVAEFPTAVGRVTPAGGVTDFELGSPKGPRGIAHGPDGNLWFTEFGDNKIGRITTTGTVTEFPIPTAGGGPRGIVAGPDGALWFTELSGNQIGRITTGAPPTSYFSVAPCRVADTRSAAGPYGGPALAANADRTFVVAGQCSIPVDAASVAFNFTVTGAASAGDLRTVPAGIALPLVSTLNWAAGQTRANNAVVSLGAGGAIVVHPDQASGTVHLIVDVNGYFK